MFISILFMFRAAMSPSSGELIVSIRHLVYVTLYKWLFGGQVHTCTPNGHLYRVTYTRCRIDIINSPDDGLVAARNMQRIEKNIHEILCVKLVIYKDHKLIFVTSLNKKLIVLMHFREVGQKRLLDSSRRSVRLSIWKNSSPMGNMFVAYYIVDLY